MSNKVEILGVAVDSITMNEAVAQVENYMDERAGVLIATANAEMIMRATHDEELFHILNAAALVVPDGAGTVWAARHLGYAMPERVAGYDMAQELMKRAPMNHRRIFFFGSAPGVADKAKAKAEELYPGIRVLNFGPGHAYGMMGLLVTLPGSGNYIVASDAVNTAMNYGPPMQYPGLAYDTRGFERTIDRIRKLENRYHAQVLFSHDIDQYETYRKAPLEWYE